MTIPQEAIEAAAIIVSGDTEKWFYEYPTSDSDRAGYRRTAHKAITAALPALEQQIREQVAESIERKLCGCGNNSPLCEINNTHFTLAAQIARGKDHA